MMFRPQALCCFLSLLGLTTVGAADATLDAGFGINGLVRPEFPGQPSLDSAGSGRCVAVQEDGKIVLAGQSLADGLRRIVVLRFLSNGQADTDFGSGGVALLASPHGDDQASALMLLEGGDILIAGRTFSEGASDMLLLRLEADGAPDAGFGTGGRLEVDFDGSDDSAQALTLDAQGRLLAAGSATQSGKRSMAVLRCLPDGTPDASFGNAGRAVFNLLSSSSSEARGLVVQSSGRIVAGGHARISTTDRLALFAFTASGAHDTSFGTDGSILTVAGSGSNIQSQGHSLIELTGGQLLLAGTGSVSGVPHAALARYTANGLLDTGFGSGGTVITSAGTGETSGRCVIQQADGSLLVAATLAGDNLRFAALRYSSGGSLDTGFGAGGVALVAFTGFDADCFAVAPASAGFILAGTLGGESSSSIGLARCTAAGALDPTLSGDGRVENNLLRTQPFAQARAVRQQPDGKILLAGSVGTGSGMDFVVCRFLADGSADTAFGTQGRAIIAPGLEDDYAYRMLLQPDGKILVAGTSLQDGVEVACMVRLLSNGSLDPDFGTGGLFFDQTGGADCGIYALALQSDGKMVAAGYAYNGTGARLVCHIWRLTASGSLDTSFSADGRLATHVTAATRDTFATAVTVQSDGKIVTAGPAYTDSGQTQASFGLVRCLANGSLDTSFDSNGLRDVALSGHAAQAQALAVQGDGALVVAGFAEVAAVGGSATFAAVRLLANGAIDSAYGTAGWTQADFAGFGDRAYDLAIDSENRALLIGTTYTTSSRIALLRLTATGATDGDLGDAGKVILASGTGNHLAYGGTLDASGRLLLAGSASGLMAARVLLPASVNTAPIAFNDTGSVLPGTTVLLNVLANDTDADNDSLTLTAWTQPAAGGTVTHTGSLLQFTASSQFTGATFTYTISDGKGGEDTATVTLTPVASYAAWRVAWFGEGADDPAIADPEVDADADGLDNLTEYALGSDPLLATTAGTPGRDGSGRLTLTYQTWVAAQDVTVTPVFCSDLASWSNIGVFLEILSDDGIRRTLRATAPVSLPLQAQFGQLQITQP